MADLKTRYMGIALDNPFIVGSSSLTGSIDGIRRCADAGAGAVVLKSMFEEIIIAGSEELERDLIQSEHPEAYEYIRAELAMQIGPQPYLKFIEDAKKATAVPVIASVNCVSSKWWVPYAKNIESAGADAIELNISHFPGADDNPADIEARYQDVVGEVAAHTSIPVSVKLSSYFTSIRRIVKNVVSAGAKGVVLFNRLYTVDIDLKKRTVVPSMTLSTPEDYLVPLRWIGLLSGEISCDFTASTGIHSPESAAKMILAGAKTVQVCSVLYRKKPEYIAEMKSGLSAWLDENGFASVEKAYGAALKHTAEENVLFKRVQYVKALEEAAGYKY